MIIKNTTLKQFITVLLNKTLEFITLEEIQKVESVRISTMNECGEHKERMDDLQQFSNLIRVIIADSLITEAEISILSSMSTLMMIEFERCVFVNDTLISKLNHIQSLILNNCLIRDYEFIAEFHQSTELQIINPYDETILDLMLVNKLPSLKKLYLERCILSGFDFFENSSLEELSLLNTSVDSFHFINKCPNLSFVLISERYVDDPVVKANSKKINFKTDIREFALEKAEPESMLK